ncbi:MAG TPA: STAS domain-containing protein [Candidatus Binatia bacterium]|jgi:anti-anti-sigma factor
MTAVRFADHGLADDVRRAIADGAATITIDLGDLAYIDPLGLRAVAAAVEVVRAAGATLRLERARPSVYKALHVARLV